jgi:hypothetical protein
MAGGKVKFSGKPVQATKKTAKPTKGKVKVTGTPKQ